MDEVNRPDALPAEVARRDMELQSHADNASLQLAEMRWQWTLDEDNPDRVRTSVYARAVGRSEFVITKYAKGYALYQKNPNEFVRISDAIESATMSQDQANAVRAVADARGISMVNARQHHRDVVREVRAAVDDAAARHAHDGRSFDDDDRADWAKRIAESKERTRQRDAREREERRQRHGRTFFDVDARLSKARREMRQALDAVRDGIMFTEEEVELLEREIDAVAHMARLVRLAVAGDSGTDWDAELAQLEERRQHGT